MAATQEKQVTQQVTHCIFDMDGLLINTEGFYTDVQERILERFNRKFTFELKSQMMGRKALEAAEILVTELKLEGLLTPEDFVAEREAALDALFPTSQLLPGAERLVRHLHASGVPFALATSSHRRHFDLKTSLHGPLFELFDHRVTGDQVANGKPHPEIFQRAASLWRPAPPAPGACLVFEDAPIGVEAAKAAGMRCVMVPDPRTRPDQCAAADAVLPSLEQFRPELWGLPPFPATR